MNINKGNIAYLCVVWTFALLLGVTFSLNAPFILLLVATVLYLLA